MAIQPLNVCMGPATLYYGAFGATEPAYSALLSPPNSAVWTDFGGIADGTSVLLEIDLTYTDIGVDQLVDPVGARLTKRTIQVTAALEEATLSNMAVAMNNLATITPGSGYSVLDPVTANSATQPQYAALLIDGQAPTTGTSESSCRRRIILRKSLSSSKIDLEYEKSKPAVYNTTWVSYYVSGSVAPFEIIDQTT